MEGHGRSWKVMEALFPITGLTFQVRKIVGEWWGGMVACKIKVSAPVLVPFLWTLDLGLGFGT